MGSELAAHIHLTTATVPGSITVQKVGDAKGSPTNRQNGGLEKRMGAGLLLFPPANPGFAGIVSVSTAPPL